MSSVTPLPSDGAQAEPSRGRDGTEGVALGLDLEYRDAIGENAGAFAAGRPGDAGIVYVTDAKTSTQVTTVPIPVAANVPACLPLF